MNAPALVANPFVGLRPFEAEESLLFFGRQQQIAELLQRLHGSRFLAVVGSSGCGKSSLVRAGLIPGLQAGFLVEDKDVWHVAKMKPGGAPIAHLAACLLTCGAEPGARANPGDIDAMGRAIREGGAAAILRWLSSLTAKGDANILLLVDQFEELFRFEQQQESGTSEEAADFVSILLDLAAQRAIPVYIVITMRSDFLGDCDLFFGLPEALNRSQYLVPRLTREQRRDAIEGPIKLYRQTIAPRLTDRLLNETIDTRDDLPVLQHALMRTWEWWKRDATGPIDIAHYEKTGTVARALSQDADAALEGMDERAMLLTKRLFQALTTVDASNRGVRRPARLNDVAARSNVTPAEVWPIVQRFRSDGRSFLIVSSEDPDANPLIDISHESLIRQWTVLGKWVAEEVESIKTYKRLAGTERLRRLGRSGLYRDQDLQAALDWQAAESPNATWAKDLQEDFPAAMEFLRESKEVRDNALAEEEFERRWRRIRWVIVVAVLMQFLTNFGTQHFWNATEEKVAETLADPQHVPKDVPKVGGEPDEVEKIAATATLALRLSTHLAIYMVVAGLAKRTYRTVAFPMIRASISGIRTRALARREWGIETVSKLVRSMPRAIEGLAKWISIIGGITILTSCTVAGIGEGNVWAIFLGLAFSALMVGWVFAVARLNGEVKTLRGEALKGAGADGSAGAVHEGNAPAARGSPPSSGSPSA
jgi:hypothetical protein